MQRKFDLIKHYLREINISIVKEIPEQEIVVVEDEENGIKNLVIDCEEPIVILEQAIMQVPNQPDDLFKKLLQMNRKLVHGAFVLDENERIILFRDTLQLENIDRNELESSIQALSLALTEFGSTLLMYVNK
ncbi:MAG: YbjN domain-containing protein [Desulfobacterales bacterium]|nr:YbjN domain-containing protein [Desulfobacterales bacterium]